MFWSRHTGLSVVVLGLAVVVATTAPEVVAADHRIRARVDEPFEINGRLFQPGEVSVQKVSQYNPTLSLNKVCVDGECLGLLLARVSPAEAFNDDHALFFERAAAGHLVLVGYAHGGDSEVQRLYEFRVEHRSLGPDRLL
jgi:hypothetical protein